MNDTPDNNIPTSDDDVVDAHPTPSAVVPPDPKRDRSTATVLFSRGGLIIALFLSTYLASTAFGYVIWPTSQYVNPATILLWLLFCLLFIWVAQGFWTATIGVLQTLRDSPTAIFKRSPTPVPRTKPTDLPRTAVLMPIYNEDAVRVFAGVEAMIRSINEQHYPSDPSQHYGVAFDFYILSDTTDPQVWLQEETQYAALLDLLGHDTRIYYRRRHQNIARKSGNIEDFCERFGAGYTFMLTLDADSVMNGHTVVEMVHRSTAAPHIGILQVPPQPVNRSSFFARSQQFAASLYGGVFNSGFSAWTHLDGNYYGHNALIRVEPFVRHCGLPLLPGKPPLGGEILSHDFVEAALIRKAGYDVSIATDLSGSYEECPTALVDYAIRDQRWCQGNMQHMRLVIARGFHPMSRLHLGMGVMSYLASPLWMAFMITGFIAHLVTAAPPAAIDTGYITWSPSAIGFCLFAVIMAMLLLPKCVAVAMVVRDHNRISAHGGDLQVVLSMLCEIAISILIAPLMMVYHTTFVVNTLLGRKVKWNAQQRDETTLTWADATRNHLKMTLGGITAFAIVAWFTPALLLWATPVLLGLIISIPLSKLLSSRSIGLKFKHAKLLMIPEETTPPRVLRLHARALERTQQVAAAYRVKNPLATAIANPTLYRLHLAALQGNRERYTTDVDLPTAVKQAKTQGIDQLDSRTQLALLSTPDTLLQLHRAAWA
ncbi:MAG: glucans biosynthesis glucosyltransferase MdoH [Algisphaera sp.]